MGGGDNSPSSPSELPQKRAPTPPPSIMAAVKGVCRLIVPAGKAKPSPAIGQALGPLGLNMMDFCKAFNDRTRNNVDDVPMRVKLRAFEDRTFDFEVHSPPTSWFLKKASGVPKGTAQPSKWWRDWPFVDFPGRFSGRAREEERRHLLLVRGETLPPYPGHRGHRKVLGRARIRRCAPPRAHALTSTLFAHRHSPHDISQTVCM